MTLKRSPRPDDILYENGPTNGTISAWQINFGFVVADSFAVSSSSRIQSLTFAAWTFPGDIMQSAEVSITSAPFGGTTFFDGTVAFTQSGCNANQFGFNLCLETGNFNVSLDPGTYWVNLQNASVNTGDPLYWDENSGPSLAEENSVGTIPSESFTLNGAPVSPTTTTLLVMPDMTTSGMAVTLTATVTDQSSNVVSTGTVTFFEGQRELATVQAVSMMPYTAILKTRFGPGSYSLTAVYNPNSGFDGSQSGPEPLTVTGPEPTISTLSAQQNGNRHNFMLSVFGFGFPPLAGSASLNDLSLSGLQFGTIQVPGPGMQAFRPQQAYGAGPLPTQVATGDFNADGIADIAVTNNMGNNVSVFLGNADGTLGAPVNYDAGNLPVGIVAWDFNNDGNLDLAVAISGANAGLSILLGKGDGTFLPPTGISINGLPYALAVADFDGDGIADIAITDTLNNLVFVARGTGGGNFQLVGMPTGTSLDPVGLAVGDFNGDGRPDLAVPAFQASSVDILLGHGDGTFTVVSHVLVDANPEGIASFDLNNDGALDLVVTSLSTENITVLLGNGNGDFTAQVPQPAGPLPSSVVIANVNGDANPDLVVTNSADPPNSLVSVLLGRGGEIFDAPQSYPVGANPHGLAVADFNGDNVPDFVSANSGDGTVSVLLGGTVSTGQLDGVRVPGLDMQNVQSNFTPSDGNRYLASPSNIVPVIGDGATPTRMQLASVPNPSICMQPVGITATVTALQGGGSPTGTVAFSDAGILISDCTAVPLVPIANGSQATCTTSGLSTGTHSQITGSYAGDNNFAASSATLDPPQIVNCPVGDFSVSVTPGSAIVTQTFNNTNDPFFAHVINIAAQPMDGYNNTISFFCSVTPTFTDGNCTVTQNPGSLSATLTINTGSRTPIGSYLVTVTGQDSQGLQHSATLNLTVIEYAPGCSMASGGACSTQVNFPPGPPGTLVTGSCPLVTGTGLSGQQPFQIIGGNCVFTPQPGMLPGPIMVTFSGCTVAELRRHAPIYATLFFGFPGIVLLGSLRVGRRSRRTLARIAVTLLLIGMIALAMACGTGSGGRLTPTGNYYVLVQGTASDGTVYSAVAPITVRPLQN